MSKKLLFILICLFAFAAVCVCPFVGSIHIPFSALGDLKQTTTESQIFYSLRLPRVFTGFLAGAALACCGVALQAMFRNPLATPFTLGISSGAAFGADGAGRGAPVCGDVPQAAAVGVAVDERVSED